MDNAPSSNGLLRCGAHRNYGTFTLVFQDSAGGLEYLSPSSNKWLPVPATVDAALLFGCCSKILSNGRVAAPVHRVRATPGAPCRNPAVFFVAPDADASLQPTLAPGEECAFDARAVEGLTVSTSKKVIAPSWRRREGTLQPWEAKYAGPSQEEVVEAFLRGEGFGSPKQPGGQAQVDGM